MTMTMTMIIDHGDEDGHDDDDHCYQGGYDDDLERHLHSLHVDIDDHDCHNDVEDDDLR